MYKSLITYFPIVKCLILIGGDVNCTLPFKLDRSHVSMLDNRRDLPGLLHLPDNRGLMNVLEDHLEIQDAGRSRYSSFQIHMLTLTHYQGS